MVEATDSNGLMNLSHLWNWKRHNLYKLSKIEPPVYYYYYVVHHTWSRTETRSVLKIGKMSIPLEIIQPVSETIRTNSCQKWDYFTDRRVNRCMVWRRGYLTITFTRRNRFNRSIVHIGRVVVMARCDSACVKVWVSMPRMNIVP